jgi:hypothetical protein
MFSLSFKFAKAANWIDILNLIQFPNLEAYLIPEMKSIHTKLWAVCLRTAKFSLTFATTK